MTLIINDTKHNATQLKGFICYHSAQENCPHTECRVLNIVMLNGHYAECRHAACYYAEYRD